MRYPVSGFSGPNQTQLAPSGITDHVPAASEIWFIFLFMALFLQCALESLTIHSQLFNLLFLESFFFFFSETLLGETTVAGISFVFLWHQG